MAAVAAAPTTTSASLNKYWRKVQGPLLEDAFAHGKRKEVEFFRGLTATPMEWSAYENTFPVDLIERGGIASIADSGAMAVPSSVNPIEGTASAVHFNGRFSISNQAQWADAGQRNQIVTQIKAQAKQKNDAMIEHISDYFWGFPTALLATTDTDLSSATPTVTLATAYGVAGITNARYMASLFKLSDRIVLTDSSNVLLDTTDSFGGITAISKANGTLTLALDGSITCSTNGIRIYKANNINGTTLADGSDLNRGLNGMLSLYTDTSVHGISGATYENWTAAYSDTAAGRFTPTKSQHATDEIMNRSGLTKDFRFVAQGVMRDMVKQQLAGVRFAQTTGMSFDGDVKSKGVKDYALKNVPPGYVFEGAREALRKWEILPMEGDKSYSELQKYQDYAASFGRTDWFGNMLCTTRNGLAYFSSQTES